MFFLFKYYKSELLYTILGIKYYFDLENGLKYLSLKNAVKALIFLREKKIIIFADYGI